MKLILGSILFLLCQQFIYAQNDTMFHLEPIPQVLYDFPSEFDTLIIDGIRLESNIYEVINIDKSNIEVIIFYLEGNNSLMEDNWKKYQIKACKVIYLDGEQKMYKDLSLGYMDIKSNIGIEKEVFGIGCR